MAWGEALPFCHPQMLYCSHGQRWLTTKFLLQATQEKKIGRSGVSPPCKDAFQKWHFQWSGFIIRSQEVAKLARDVVTMSDDRVLWQGRRMEHLLGIPSNFRHICFTFSKLKKKNWYSRRENAHTLTWSTLTHPSCLSLKVTSSEKPALSFSFPFLYPP